MPGECEYGKMCLPGTGAGTSSFCSHRDAIFEGLDHLHMHLLKIPGEHGVMMS